MKIRRSNILLITLIGIVLFLSGCKSALLVYNAKVEDITPILDDYVGAHGYKMTYRNDESGSYRISLGDVYVPGKSETTKTKEITQQTPPPDSNQPFTAYEETTWRTVSVPGRYVEATAIVSIVQQDADVLIEMEAYNMGISALDDLRDYIKDFGYAVENK